MKKYFEWTGLYFPKLVAAKVKMPKYKYKKKVTEAHLAYLKELAAFHQDRQATIESKTAQLVGQSSIVFSLFALFVPLFYDKFVDFHLTLKSYLIVLFALAFIFYLFSIIHAARSLSIHKYRYSMGDADSVMREMEEKEFLEDQVKDLVYSINTNSHVDDQKGTNLILAHRTFTIANFMFAVMTLSTCVILIFANGSNKDQEVTRLLEQIGVNENRILLEIKKSNYYDSIQTTRSVQDSIK